MVRLAKHRVVHGAFVLIHDQLPLARFGKHQCQCKSAPHFSRAVSLDAIELTTNEIEFYVVNEWT